MMARVESELKGILSVRTEDGVISTLRLFFIAPLSAYINLMVVWSVHKAPSSTFGEADRYRYSAGTG